MNGVAEVPILDKEIQEQDQNIPLELASDTDFLFCGSEWDEMDV